MKTTTTTIEMGFDTIEINLVVDYFNATYFEFCKTQFQFKFVLSLSQVSPSFFLFSPHVS